MSARIYRLLADELDISEERAQKLLRAMLREVQKRAQRGGGIRIPNLGAFVVRDGEMEFTPSDSLARAVNHRYEGLVDEDLSTADRRSEDSDDGEEGPTTITTGFHQPLSGASSEGGDSSSDADTDEFQVDETSASDADTAEFQTPTDETSPDEPAPDAVDSRQEPTAPTTASSTGEAFADEESEERDAHPATSEPAADETATEEYRQRKGAAQRPEIQLGHRAEAGLRFGHRCHPHRRVLEHLDEDPAETEQDERAELRVAVHADDGPLAGLDLLLVAAGGVGDLLLEVAGADALDHAADLVDLLEDLLGLLLHPVGFLPRDFFSGHQFHFGAFRATAKFTVFHFC